MDGWKGERDDDCLREEANPDELDGSSSSSFTSSHLLPFSPLFVRLPDKGGSGITPSLPNASDRRSRQCSKAEA